MTAPEWLKPGLYGAAAGAAALAIVGFSWGGWVTGGTAARMASEQAQLEVVTALVPFCIEKSKQDPQVMETLAQLKEASSYKRSRHLRTNAFNFLELFGCFLVFFAVLLVFLVSSSLVLKLFL